MAAGTGEGAAVYVVNGMVYEEAWKSGRALIVFS